MQKTNLKEALQELVEEYKKKLSAQAKIEKLKATGQFAKSFTSKVTADGFEISSTSPYAGALDGGSKPSKNKSKAEFEKKLTNIEIWAKAKNVRPIRKLKNGYKFAKTKTPQNSAFKAMVRGIAFKTGQRGTIKRYNYEGSKIFEKVFTSMQKKIGLDVGSAYSADLRKELIKIVKTNK